MNNEDNEVVKNMMKEDKQYYRYMARFALPVFTVLTGVLYPTIIGFSVLILACVFHLGYKPWKYRKKYMKSIDETV